MAFSGFPVRTSFPETQGFSGYVAPACLSDLAPFLEPEWNVPCFPSSGNFAVIWAWIIGIGEPLK